MLVQSWLYFKDFKIMPVFGISCEMIIIAVLRIQEKLFAAGVQYQPNQQVLYGERLVLPTKIKEENGTNIHKSI